MIKKILEQAKSDPKRIAFPEPEDPRVIKAVCRIAREGIAIPALIGSMESLKTLYPKRILSTADFIEHDDRIAMRFVPRLLVLRESKGLTMPDARNLLRDPMYLAAMLLDAGDVDGIVSGAAHPTKHTLRPAFEIIGVTDDCQMASSFFLMLKNKKSLFFADCAINPDPSVEDLACCAVQTAKSARWLGIQPIVAMLSFSTKGSASHPLVEKVKKAVGIAKALCLEGTIIDGEIQFDAAIVPSICKSKAPDSPIQGRANVFIFPDLQSGNIGYKIAEHLGGFSAIGPIIQGLKKPVNDLSRGCSVQDIINVTAITVVQAQALEKEI